MDTRKKIVSPAEARAHLAEGNWLVVAGYFDPLTAFVAGRLNNLAADGVDRKVLAIVFDRSDMLLSPEARSELIAALRVVDLVSVMCEMDLSGSVPRDPRIRFVFDEEAERKNSAEFSALVVGKEGLVLQGGEVGS